MARPRLSSSVHVMQERLPGSGRMANGPAGRKCCTARERCGFSWATTVTMPICGYCHPTTPMPAASRSRDPRPSAATTSGARSVRPSERETMPSSAGCQAATVPRTRAIPGRRASASRTAARSRSFSTM